MIGAGVGMKLCHKRRGGIAVVGRDLGGPSWFLELLGTLGPRPEPCEPEKGRRRKVH